MMDREKGELDKRTAEKTVHFKDNNESMKERTIESRASQNVHPTTRSLASVNAAGLPDSPKSALNDKYSRTHDNDVFSAKNREEVENRDSFVKNNPTEKSLGNEDTVVVVVCAVVSVSSEGHQTGRVDLHMSDDRIYTMNFRKQHGIRNVIATKRLSVTNDSEARVLVRLLLRGEDKDSWRHCETQDGKKAFDEEQRLDLAKILRHRSAFPVTAHWFLETPEKCPPSLHLEAVLQIQPVPRGVTSPIWDDSSEVITISVEIGD